MPERKTRQAAARDKREGKSPSTQAGEYVHEEIEHVRKGKHGVRSAQQAIAIGLSKARRAGVKLPRKKSSGKQSASKSGASRKRASTGKSATRKRATAKRSSAKRTDASSRALRREGRSAASKRALSAQGKRAASRRSAASRSVAAKKAARTRKRAS